MSSMTTAASRRSGGSRDSSCFASDPSLTEPAGCAIAVAWKLMVAGGMGRTRARMPPRRTGTSRSGRQVSIGTNSPHVEALFGEGCRALQRQDQGPLAVDRRPRNVTKSAAATKEKSDMDSPAGYVNLGFIVISLPNLALI